MVSVQARVLLQMDVVDATLADYAALSLTLQAAIRDGFESNLYGSQAAAVKALLASTTFLPTVNVDSRGLASVADRWSAVQAAVSAYNALGTGLALVLPSVTGEGETPPDPDSTFLIWRNGEWVLVTDWEASLTQGGTTRRTRDLSADSATPVPTPILGVMHVAIEVAHAY